LHALHQPTEKINILNHRLQCSRSIPFASIKKVREKGLAIERKEFQTNPKRNAELAV
jgi:hypothetical protein